MFRSTFRAFRNRNYRFFFFGHGTSLIGTWMQTIALGWYVYRVTSSPFWLGVVSFSSHIPSFFLTLFAGVIADTHDKLKILKVTQAAAMVQAFLLYYLVASGSRSLVALITLTTALGIINAFDAPVRQSFVYEMLDEKEDISNAIALNSGIFNSARLIGPSVAGFVVHYFGEGPCFLLNALSYIAVLAALFMMRIEPRDRAAKKASVLADLREGFRYSFGFMPIRSIIVLIAFTSMLGMSYNVLMPVFARDILHGDSKTMGFLVGSVGCGALTGVLYLARRKKLYGIENVICVSSMLLGAGLILFSRSRSFALSAACLYLTGIGMISTMASSNTFLQNISDEDKRGRVLSLYVMALIGMAPFGSLFAGFVSDRIGAPSTLMICGAFCIINSLNFIRRMPEFRRIARPVLAAKGIR